MRLASVTTTVHAPVSSKLVQATCALFLVKPFIDLMWFTRVRFLGLSLAPGHLVGLLIAVGGVSLVLAKLRLRPVALTIFLVFMLSYFGSILLTAQYGRKVNPVIYADHLCRVVDSLIFLHLGYLIGLRRRESEGFDILKSILIGNSIVMFLNTVAILLGFQLQANVSGNVIRNYGLYYDPGVLAINAVQNIVFAIYFGSVYRGKWRTLIVIGLPLLSVFLIWSSVSRSGFILLIVIFTSYAGVYQRGSSRTVSLALFGTGVAAVMLVLAPDTGRVRQRFDTEVRTFERISEGGLGEVGFVTRDKFSFGNLEWVGGNRGGIAAAALSTILRRPLELQLFGYFDGGSCHCDYVDILGRNGFVGFGIYLVLLAFVWGSMYRRVVASGHSTQRMVAGTTLCLITIYILYSFPHRPLSYTTNSWYMWCLLGWSSAWSTSKVSSKSQTRIAHRSTPQHLPAESLPRLAANPQSQSNEGIGAQT